jgi:MFS family permease
MKSEREHKNRMLCMVGCLHAFTHAFQVALMPLYLLIQRDFGLHSVGQATLLLTIMMLAYFLPSYPMGVFADHHDRRRLLGIGLALNALGFVLLAWSPSFAWAVVAVILAGFGGSFFHPAATAMVARAFPMNTGKALGLVGIGASVGFFAGPLYAGWRAGSLEPMLGAAAWRRPILEMGIFGLIVAAVFAKIADPEQDGGDTRLSKQNTAPEGASERPPLPGPLPLGGGEGVSPRVEAPSLSSPSPPARGRGPRRGGLLTQTLAGSPSAPDSHQLSTIFPTPVLWLSFLACAVAFSLRDFAGASMGSLGSLFLQNAHGYDPKWTGLALSVIFLPSVISNPVFGSLSDRGRSRWLAAVILLAAVMVAIFPHVPAHWIVPVLVIYGFFLLSSYPMTEAALMNAVPDAVRGRVFGLFITVSGLLSNLSHWCAGAHVKNLGDRANSVAAYFPAYTLMALMMAASLTGLFFLRVIRREEHLPTPVTSSPLPMLE